MMMTSISKIDLPSSVASLASRECGSAALASMLAELQTSEVLEIDFGGQVPTPSFADQSIGNLAKTLGVAAFRQRVRLLNVPESARLLIRHVILKSAS